MTEIPIRLVVFGDTTLDVTVRSPSPPLAGSDRQARITLGPGGQGANLSVRLARRGARVALVTALADDLAGHQLRDALAADGVALVSLPAARSGIVLSWVSDTGERAMLSDRVPFAVEALSSTEVHAALESGDWIHLSGYPLADPGSGDALAAMAGARRAGQGCSVGGGSFVGGNALLARLRAARPDLLLVDRAEASALLFDRSTAPAPEPAETLAAAVASAIGGVAVVTDGPAGAAAATGDQTMAVPASAEVTVDATGAGDAHAARILLALAGGPWPPSARVLRDALEQAGRLGAEVAGVVGAQARVTSEGGR